MRAALTSGSDHAGNQKKPKKCEFNGEIDLLGRSKRPKVMVHDFRYSYII
jgi:hypothetical protein